jgi:tRNA (cytidine32/uridine32-2'-O)-methyltransferase
VEANIDNIRVVLVNTSHPGNIGASARAMKNMGLANMTLVAPEQFPSGVAVGRAASAVDVLEQALVVSDLPSALADCGLVVGASARSRKIPWPMLTPKECAERALKESKNNKVALVFGREDSGLSNEELQLCHYHVQIPSNPACSSLNLAAAVMVICYELYSLLSGAAGKSSPSEEEYWDMAMATGQQLEQFYAHLEKVLVRVAFHDPDNPRMLMQRMRRLFGRIRIDAMEMNILRGLLSHLEHHLDQARQERQ